MKFDIFQDNILGWADVRHFKKGTTELHQQVKTLEEIGEFMLALDKYKKDPTAMNYLTMMLEAGDIAVCIVISNSFDGDRRIEIGLRPCSSDISDIVSSALDAQYHWAIDYLIEVCNFHKIDFENCLEAVWNKIKDRKGMWIDKFYVKYESMTEDQKQEFNERETGQ